MNKALDRSGLWDKTFRHDPRSLTLLTGSSFEDWNCRNDFFGRESYTVETILLIVSKKQI